VLSSEEANASEATLGFYTKVSRMAVSFAGARGGVRPGDLGQYRIFPRRFTLRAALSREAHRTLPGVHEAWHLRCKRTEDNAWYTDALGFS